MPRLLLPATALLTLALAACAAQPDEQSEAVAQSEQRAQEDARPAPPEPAATPASACDDSQAQWAIGKAATEADVEQARKDSGAKVARILKPGQMVTMEFNGERLNLDVDDAGKVSAVRCG